MVINATQLRKDVYQILDEVLASGRPIEIERKGRRLRLSPAVKTPTKLARLKKRSILNVKAQELTSLNWSDEWSHDLP